VLCLITVRVFGVTRLLLKVNRLEIDANSVGEALKIISNLYENITLKELKNCIIFVNGTNIIELKRFNTKIKDRDEIQIFSPVGGG
jgi:molybdopterin converting factor small subunit